MAGTGTRPMVEMGGGTRAGTEAEAEMGPGTWPTGADVVAVVREDLDLLATAAAGAVADCRGSGGIRSSWVVSLGCMLNSTAACTA